MDIHDIGNKYIIRLKKRIFFWHYKSSEYFKGGELTNILGVGGILAYDIPTLEAAVTFIIDYVNKNGNSGMSPSTEKLIDELK